MTDEDLAIREEEAVEEERSDEDEAMAKLKELISVTTEELGPLRLKLTVTVPKDHIHRYRTSRSPRGPAEAERSRLGPRDRKSVV